MQNEEQEFEKKLFQSLKYYGYLFPSNIKDVERFEELYGDTEIDIPDHLQSLELLNSDTEISLGIDFSYNIAAFSANNHNQFDLPNDIDSDKIDKDDKDEDILDKL